MSAVIDIDTLLEVRPGYRSGRPCIAGTGITVHVIAAHHDMGETAEEIHDGFPHAPLAGIYAALAYYHAHHEEIQADMDEDDRLADDLDAIPNARIA